MSVVTLNLDELKRHVGARHVATDVVTAAPANLLRLAFDRPEPVLAELSRLGVPASRIVTLRQPIAAGRRQAE